jgi:hypothetical protein
VGEAEALGARPGAAAAEGVLDPADDITPAEGGDAGSHLQRHEAGI